jgi:phosphoribosyl 1,2-cyclic phosphodiesterase
MEIRALASGSKGNAYLVSDGLTPLLIECGIKFPDLRRMLNFRMSEIVGCLISHEHNDHCRAVQETLKAGIDCYMSLGTARALGVSNHRVHIVWAQEQFTVGTWTILPFDTVHDAVEPLGFLLSSRAGKLLYLTDTAYCKYRFQGLTHIMIECNYSLDILRENTANRTISVDIKNRIIRTHFSLENVKEFLRANDLSQVQEIWLLHLSDTNSDAGRFKQEIQAITGKPVYVA